MVDFASYVQSSKNFNLQKDSYLNLKGAIVSFAVSSYFTKNDNISDVLKPFILATKKRHQIIYNIINKTNPTNNPNYLTAKSLLVG